MTFIRTQCENANRGRLISHAYADAFVACVSGQELDVFCNIEYPGGFSIGIDAELSTGALASVAIKVHHLAVKGRLQFSRKPYTHWSFACYEVSCWLTHGQIYTSQLSFNALLDSRITSTHRMFSCTAKRMLLLETA